MRHLAFSMVTQPSVYKLDGGPLCFSGYGQFAEPRKPVDHANRIVQKFLVLDVMDWDVEAAGCLVSLAEHGRNNRPSGRKPAHGKATFDRGS
jgi:hypothetical protein